MDVPIEHAVAVRRRAGTVVTLVNQGAQDVYFSTDPNRLNTVPAGTVPDGTKIANGGGWFQWPNFPGVVWVRAAVAAKIEVIS